MNTDTATYLTTVKRARDLREGMRILHLDGEPAVIATHRIQEPDAYGYSYGMTFEGEHVPYACRPEEEITVYVRVPYVLDGATMHVGSDRYPYTVTSVSPSGKVLTIRACAAVRTDHNGQSESQTWEITEDENGHKRTAYWRPVMGHYYADGAPLSIGSRSRHVDPHY